MSTFNAQTLAQPAPQQRQPEEESPQSNLYPAPLIIRKVSQGIENIQLAMPIRTAAPGDSLDMLLDGVRAYQAKAEHERDAEQQAEVAMKTENNGEVKRERPVKKAMKTENDVVEAETAGDENGNENVRDRDGDETESDNQSSSSSSSSSDMETQAGSGVDEDEYVDVEMEDIDDLSDLLDSSEEDDHQITTSRSISGNGLGISLLAAALGSGSGSTTTNATASATSIHQPLLLKINRKPLPSSTKLPESDDDETEDEKEDNGASIGEGNSLDKIHITTANMTWGESMLYREPGLAQFRVARPSHLRVCWTWVEQDQGGGRDVAVDGSEEGEMMEGM